MDQGPTIVPTTRPRPRSRGISFASNKSGNSEGKLKYQESPKDKARRDSFWKGLSKANPNAAIIEAQPGVASVIEHTTLQNLREVPHKDAYGNEIADPDLSNPTRPRLERPLDTIRSFEKAIDDGYKRRSSYMRQDADRWDQNNQYASRRSSYFGGLDNSPTHHGPGGGGGYYGNQNGYHGNRGAPPSRLRNGDRQQSDSQLYGSHKPHHAQHGYQSSYDTVNTRNSDSTGPWASGTDPSSENSSIDRVKPQTPISGYDNYASNGYNGPIMEEQAPNGYGEYPQQNGYGHQNGYPQQNGYGAQPNGYAPQEGAVGQPEFRSPRQIYARNNSATMPQPQMSNGRRPIQKLGDTTGASQPIPGGHLPSNQREPESKRKSWLARKFTKN